jgi:hypothetical protein
MDQYSTPAPVVTKIRCPPAPDRKRKATEDSWVFNEDDMRCELCNTPWYMCACQVDAWDVVEEAVVSQGSLVPKSLGEAFKIVNRVSK